MEPPNRTLRDEHAEATRAALIASARRLFGSAGFTATSIDEVASAARVTKGAVYHHFANKEQLFRAVYDQIEADVQARSGAAGAGVKDPVERLRKGIDAYLDATLEPDVQRITLIDAPSVLGLDADGPADSQPGHVGMRAFIAAAVEAGEIRSVDAESLTHLIRGACLQAGLMIAHSPKPATTRKRVGATLHVLIDGLRV